MTQTTVADYNCAVLEHRFNGERVKCVVRLANGAVIRTGDLVVKGQPVGLDKNNNHVCRDAK